MQMSIKLGPVATIMMHMTKNTRFRHIKYSMIDAAVKPIGFFVSNGNHFGSGSSSASSSKSVVK